MAHEAIEQYLTSILQKQLEAYGVCDDFIKRIIGTVRSQIISCVFHWSDVKFRKALLLIGSEEGIQYEPYAGDDIRNFVVVTIRNSEIETIQSRNCTQAGLSDHLNSADVRDITSAAIEYFKGFNFIEIQTKVESPSPDIYADLAKKYSVAWGALTKLANSKTQIVDYGKEARPFPVSIDALPYEQETRTLLKDVLPSGFNVSLVSDGISFSIDRHLKEMLAQCVNEGMPFVTPCFKFLTRNIEKLLLIMEYLLSNDVPFVTANYYLSNGHTERRLKLLKAGRSYADSMYDLRRIAGLGAKHSDVLNAAAHG